MIKRTYMPIILRPNQVDELREANQCFIVSCIPWSVIEPYEEQAKKNHAQNLDRLAARGGLGLQEAAAIMQGFDVFNRKIGLVEANDFLVEKLIAYRNAKANSQRVDKLMETFDGAKQTQA